MRAFTFRISRAWISISVACPRNHPAAGESSRGNSAGRNVCLLPLRLAGKHHRCCLTHTDSAHIRLDELHGVINGHTCRNHAARGVNVQVNVFSGFSASRNSICATIRFAMWSSTAGQKDNAFLEQTGIDIKERSPREVCSITIGTRAIWGAKLSRSPLYDISVSGSKLKTPAVLIVTLRTDYQPVSFI